MELDICMTQAQGVLGHLAVNDLTEEMEGTYSGELVKMKASINAVVQTLAMTMVTVRRVVAAS